MARQLLFSSADAAAVTFAISCQWEMIASLRLMAGGAGHIPHRRWAASTGALLDNRFDLLFDLVGSASRRDYIPDFLTPMPSTLEPSVRAELDEIAHTPAEVVRAELEHLRHRWTPRLAALHERPERVSDVADQLKLYWEIALAPHWPRIYRVLHGEVGRRARNVATVGVGRLLNDIHERVRWDGAQLEIVGTSCFGAEALEGTGIRLIPSVFVWPSVLVVADRRPAQLCFPARGAGALWDGRREPTQALSAVLGQAKARLLTVLDEPMSSPELAVELQLRPPSVSEHLATLRNAGLVTSYRVGRRLVSLRTELGTGLIDANGVGAAST
ncbi:MAG: helix-turn-helix transcriptional regulator [Streptosporangiaceae bacterium]|nr:helix-turn-helix transcriptional regulator [Streptosporangiaceae bacterium]MBV9857760.1 helix-turn-helix transcriptional regulator [Streptosporangiaceae bacterium]